MTETGTVPVRTTRIDGRLVRYWTVGPDSGDETAPRRAALLMHGLAGSGEVWTRCLPLLAQSDPTRLLVAPDLPGFGRSEGPSRALDIDAMADWSARFLDALAIGRVDVVGHSMGCQAALALAERHAGRVGTLVLAGPTLGSRNVPAWRHLTGMILGGHREPLHYKVLAARMFWRMGLRRYLATVGGMMADDAVGRASGIAAPCLVVRGSRDPIIPESAARRLADTMRRGAYVSLEKGAHVVPYNNADEFARLVQPFWGRDAENAPGPVLFGTGPGVVSVPVGQPQCIAASPQRPWT